MVEIIQKYFPNLTTKQQLQFEQLNALYRDLNTKINVISRKDIDNLYEHHVLHSLAIAKAVEPIAGSKVLDFGTGGGFPGIPLAIMFPQVHFRLIDGTGKKIKVAKQVAQSIELKNVEAIHLRGEEEKGKYDFIVSRAVMPLPDLMKIIRKNMCTTHRKEQPNGLYCLKGGDLTEETKTFSKTIKITNLSSWFEEDWFKQDKKLIYIPF